MQTDTAPTTADHDLVRDVGHTAGLAITETSGSLAPILTHAPSTKILDDGRLRTSLAMPRTISFGESNAAHRALVENGAEVVDTYWQSGRWWFVVELGRERHDRSRWDRAAARRIVPGGK